MALSPSFKVPAMALRPLLGTVLLALVLTGCASSSRVLTGQPRPAIDPALVQVYSTPPAGSIEIAQIEATSAAGFGTQGQADAAVARLKREAAALGANGVVLIGVGNQRAPVSVGLGGGSYGSHGGVGLGVGVPATQKNAAGVAIWVPDNAGALRSEQDVEALPQK